MSIGTIIGNAIGNSVAEALSKEAEKPTNDLKQSDVAKVAAPVETAVKAAVTREVQSMVDHATNSEAHWYQKRSFWSAIVSMGGVILAPIAARYGLDGYLTPDNLDTVVETLTKASGALAAYLAYRAGTALKPLGE